MLGDERVPPIVELRRDFGLDADEARSWPTGFESECWIIDERWLVKVWHSRDHAIDLDAVVRLADAGLPVPRPLRTNVVRTDDGRPFTVFPYVHGRHATGSDWGEVARTLRRVHDLPAGELGLSITPPDDACASGLRSRLDQPWVAHRADVLNAWLDRFESVRDEAQTIDVPVVLSHDDFGGLNLLLDDAGNTAAILDWDCPSLAPREHDLWLVIDEDRPRDFLDAYGPTDPGLDLSHVEHAILRRALEDICVRVAGGVDRPGIQTWGFDRLARIDETLALFQ